MTWHGYFAIEDLNLNAGQRKTLIDALKALGPRIARQPAHLCHWRVSLDRTKIIFEARFNKSALTVDTFKQRLGTIFGVSWVTIGHSTQSVTFAIRPTLVVTFSRTGTDYLRIALFGGAGAAWAQSGDECRAYLAANREEWGREVPRWPTAL